MILRIFFSFLFVFSLWMGSAFAQVKLGSRTTSATTIQEVDYDKPKTYEIGGIEIKGVKFLDPNTIIQLSGFKVGDKIERTNVYTLMRRREKTPAAEARKIFGLNKPAQ